MIEQLKERKTQLIAYLNSKILAQDWHAIQDAASDIREIEAQLKILVLVKNLGVDMTELENETKGE